MSQLQYPARVHANLNHQRVWVEAMKCSMAAHLTGHTFPLSLLVKVLANKIHGKRTSKTRGKQNGRMPYIFDQIQLKGDNLSELFDRKVVIHPFA